MASPSLVHTVRSLLVAGAVSVALLGAARAHAQPCSDYDTLTTHPATYKYLKRGDWKVYKIPEGTTHGGLVVKLTAIQAAYHNVPTPAFFKELLYPESAPSAFESWVYESRNLRAESREHEIILVPNPEYFGGFNPTADRDGSSGFNAAMVQWPFTARWLKCRDGGAVAIAWFRSPSFVDEAAYEVDRQAIAAPPAQGVYAYKTNILDLVEADVGWLEHLKEDALIYARSVYGYNADDKDRITLYFHWPTGEATNTLHLHIRVNYLMSAVEYHRAVMLDDLINYMRTQHKPAVEYVAEMVEAQGAMIVPGFGADENVLANVFKLQFGNVEPTTLPSPFKDQPKTIMRVFGDPYNGWIQTVSVNPLTPSVIRFGQVPRATELDAQAGLFVTNPFTGGRVRVLNSAEIIALKLTAYNGLTVGQLFACIQPFFDSDNLRAQRCMKFKGGQLVLEPVRTPGT